MMKAETDLGPRVSLLLNSLLLKSLQEDQHKPRKSGAVKPQYFLSKLRVIILLGKYMEKFRHWLRQMLKIRKILNDRCLCPCIKINTFTSTNYNFYLPKACP